MRRTMRILGLSLAAAAALAQGTVTAEVSTPLVPFQGAGGHWRLIYELHLTNGAASTQTVTKVEVLGEDGPIDSVEGKTLASLMARKGKKGDEARTLALGEEAVVFLDLLVEEQAPEELGHRVTLDGGAIVEAAPVRLRAAKPLVIGPPLSGTNWVAANGPGNRSDHRRALMTVDGRAVIAQRFATDWVQANGDSTFHGDRKDNRSYYAYGAPALAVADATVAAVRDGIPENEPGENSRAVAMTRENATGNHVVLDLGGGNYCLYAHLQPGSLKVKAGEKVHRGQAIGLVGNSGNSDEPHLHFQVMDGPSPLGAEGLPYHIDAFEVLRGNAKGKKENALPMDGMVVRF